MSENAVRPKLVLPRAAEALRWYAEVLAAEVVEKYDAGGEIVFASVRVFGTTLTVKDADGVDHVPEPGQLLDVVLEDPDAIAERMVAGGAEVVFAVTDQPYGARGGRVRDPFGVQWLLQTPISLSPDEVQSVIDEMAG